MAKKEKELDAPKKLKILFTIVNRNKAEFYVDQLETFDVNLQTIVYGTHFIFDSIYHKTIDTESAVIISVVNEEKIPEIMAAYEDKFFKIRNGNGFGFSVPMDSTIGVMAYKFLANLGDE